MRYTVATMDEEVERLVNVLRTATKLLGITNREIEKKLGLSYGYLSRLFGGTIELRVEHIVRITKAIGVRPAEFFHLAYPRLPVPASPAALKLQGLLQGYQPTSPAEPPPPAAQPAVPSKEELEKLIMSSLRKLLAEFAKPPEG
jgi:transcriptional regulator with XRE-family HTH domain